MNLLDTQIVNAFEGCNAKGKLKAPEAKTSIDIAKLMVSEKASKKEYGLDSEVLKVDFKVIVARMNKELRQTFETEGSDIYNDYLRKS